MMFLVDRSLFFGSITATAIACCFSQPWLNAAERPAGGIRVAQVQVAVPNVASKDEADFVNVFLPAPRELRQRIYRAQKALAEKRYSDAVSELGALLDGRGENGLGDAAAEDYFLGGSGQPGTQTSLKTEARRLLGSMPAAGRELYELQYGAEARRMLSEAIAQHDIQKLAEVTRRFSHTKAGHDATLLLGRYYLDQGRPLAGALCLRRVAELPGADDEPELSVLLAACWRLAGRTEEARETLAQLRRRKPGARLQIAGKEVRLYNDVNQSLAWIDEIIGSWRATRTAAESEWVLYRGDAARNAQTRGGLPLMRLRWRVPVANNPRDEFLVQQLGKQYLDQVVPALPGLQPLAVGDVILMRTTRQLMAVNIDTGKRIWEYPWEESDDKLMALAGGGAKTDVASLRTRQLQQRIWDDAPFGQLSSDGRSVFLIEDLGFAAATGYVPRFIVVPRGIRQQNPDFPKSHNLLVALDLATEGKTRWQLGGDTGFDEPRLAGAFFLGPPLPLFGQLFVVAETRGEIQLAVLDAESGQLQWSQQLAHVDMRNIVMDPGRRLAGATPSFADGVLVCPTSAGAVVAVDIATQSLLWGYEYRKQTPKDPRRAGVFHLGTRPQPLAQAGSRWCDATVTIADGRALITPVDSDELHCLDLVTGKPVWPPRKRGEMLYVACVHDGHAILVGKQHVTAIELANGKDAWKSPLKIPSGAMPSGRGFVSDGRYFLPTTAPDLVQIDLSTGGVLKVVHPERLLGNLICYRGQVLSQGSDWLAAYYQVEPLRSLVGQRLQQDSQDAWAIEHQGLLLIADGKRREALETLRQALRLYPPRDPRRDGTQQLLVETLLDALQEDFAANGELAAEVDELIDHPIQRAKYLRLMAEGLEKSGQLSEAFQSYLKLAELERIGTKLVDLENSGQEMERVSRQLSVRRDRWIRVRLERLMEDANQQQRQYMDTVIEQWWQQVRDNGSVKQLQQFMEYFGAHPAANRARLMLAERLVKERELLPAELLLASARQDPDRQIAGGATAWLARLYEQGKRFDQAARCYRQLQSSFADVVCVEGLTGRQLVQSLPPESPTGRLLNPAAARWPFGRVEVASQAPRTSVLTRTLVYPIDLRDARGGFPEGDTVVWDQQQTSVVLRDALGRSVCGAVIPPSQGNPYSYRLIHGKAHGHLLVLSVGFDLVAIDMLRAASDPNESILWRESLRQMVPNTVNRYRPVQTRTIQNPWGARINRLTDSSGNLVAGMGSISHLGLCFQKLRHLYCVDPLKGEPVWVRSDIHPASDLFGDDELLFVVPPKSTQARVFSLLDGEDLGSRKVVSADRVWTTVGRYLLNWKETTEDGQPRLILRLYDPWTESDVWSHAFQQGSKGQLVRFDEVAVMQPDGQFVVIDLKTGRRHVDAQLEPESVLQDIYVFRTSQQYLAVINRPAVAKPGYTIRSFPTSTYAPMINGRVYAFDRDTGITQWPTPAVVDHFGLPLDQAAELPVLLFMRQVIPRSRSSGTSHPTAVLCLDKRDGRVAWSQDKLNQVQRYELVGEPEKHTVVLTLPGYKTFTLHFTDQPRPPEPPAQDDQLTRVGGPVSTVASAVLHAFRGTFLAPARAAPDPFGGDPFGSEEDDPFR